MKKKINLVVDVYNKGLDEDYNFWSQIYDDYPLPEEKCEKKKLELVKTFKPIYKSLFYLNLKFLFLYFSFPF